MKDYNTIVQNLLKNNFENFNYDNRVLVLTDDSTQRLGLQFFDALKAEVPATDIIVMADRSKSGEEPPEEIAEAMTDYNVVFCLTKHSLTHTHARKNANDHGTQVITMPGVTEDMFLNGAMQADYALVEKETLMRAAELTNHQKAVIKTGGKYKLELPLGDRPGIPSTGVFRGPVASGNLPSGEAFIAPLEGQSHGQIEINASMAGIGILDEPSVLTIEDGRLTHATGEAGARLLELLGEENGRVLCELGIGTNYKARITGHILEDEKAYNTVHVAFGSNDTFGGTNKANVHLDCVTRHDELSFE